MDTKELHLVARFNLWQWIKNRPVKRGLDRLAFIIFEERDPNSKVVGWGPGQGTHGGAGGQVPPYVPYNPDWDPSRKRRRRNGGR